MDAQPLLWVSDASLDRLREALTGRLSAWAQSWGLPSPGAVSVQAWHASEAPLTNDLAAAASAPTAWGDCLSQALFGGKGLRSAIVGPVLQDCHDQLRTALLPADAVAAAAQAGRPGHAGARLEVALLGYTWAATWPVAALMAAGQLVRPQPGPVPRWAAASAMAALPVELTALVGTAEVDVLGVMNLAPGDVIVLRQRLDDPVSVQGVNTPLSLHAHLGAQADRVALQWLAPTPN